MDDDEILKVLFSSFHLGNLKLKNRIIRAGCFEGMCEEGNVSEKLIKYHTNLAKGGLGLTTLSYCSVSFDGRAFDNEIWLRREILPNLKRLVKSVHKEGCKISVQLGHCGYFSEPKVIKKQPMGASKKFCWFRLSFGGRMTEKDIEEKVKNFVDGALLVKEAGFDCIEVHAGHGYLLSQFLSKFTNKRSDKYGGILENRMRFPAKVIREIRKNVGKDFPIIVKMNQDDYAKNGITLNEAIKIAQMFEREGATAICGTTSASSALDMIRGELPIEEMANNHTGLYRYLMKNYGKFFVRAKPFSKLFLLEGAKTIQSCIKIPVIYVGGITSLEDIGKVFESKFPLFQIGRWLIHDENFPNRLKKKEIRETGCNQCNKCVGTIEMEEGLFCYYERFKEKIERKKKEKSWKNVIIALIIVLIFGILLGLIFGKNTRN